MAGDHSAADNSWKKIVIAKSNNEWQTGNSVKIEAEESIDGGYDPFQGLEQGSSASVESAGESSPIARKRKGSHSLLDESQEQRARRLAKMSAYAARRLANESPTERGARLARMSAYAARRLAEETPDQRAARLARMSAYAARRLAQETPEQRSSRLARMSAYAARRHKIKKLGVSDPNFITLSDGSVSSSGTVDHSGQHNS